MSAMRSPYANKKIEPIAICTSDLHLSHKPPVWRSREPDWYAAMKRPLDEVEDLRQRLIDSGDSGCRLLIAGDIFHKWNSPPSLINFAIDRIPVSSYAIPGQHDLPNHMDEQYENSPYATLCKAGTFIDVDNTFTGVVSATLFGYGWNTQLNLGAGEKGIKQISMIHRYVWMDGCSYHSAPVANKCNQIAEQLGKPKLIISGDNHIGFWHKPTRIFNCGSLMRLNRDQQNYKPRVGIVYSDCSVIPYYLDTDNDVVADRIGPEEIDNAEQKEEIDDFLHELAQMGRGGLDYLDAVRRYAKKHDVRKATQQLIEFILTGDST